MKFTFIITFFLTVALLGTAISTAHAAGMEGKGMQKNESGMGMMDCPGMGSGMMGGMGMGMQGRMGMKGDMGGGMGMGIKSQLTPEQKVSFDAAIKELHKKIELTHQALFVKNQELIALQKAPTPDVQAVSKTATEIMQLHSTLRSEKETFEEKIKKDFNLKDLQDCIMPDVGTGHGAH